MGGGGAGRVRLEAEQEQPADRALEHAGYVSTTVFVWPTTPARPRRRGLLDLPAAEPGQPAGGRDTGAVRVPPEAWEVLGLCEAAERRGDGWFSAVRRRLRPHRAGQGVGVERARLAGVAAWHPRLRGHRGRHDLERLVARRDLWIPVRADQPVGPTGRDRRVWEGSTRGADTTGLMREAGGGTQ
ncbi:hypothetical protein SCOCK_50257 [Actinacidiphila cocklensis]|uniref:Uncharacterized protein n=1 Tax=Actinacidiphila cocklensis TaxID=887465 RepID=A0A9W4GUD8_9ACTN|nr:hypothetical protein SCOCK_50257 [Actinacidiphila cocklensis]